MFINFFQNKLFHSKIFPSRTQFLEHFGRFSETFLVTLLSLAQGGIKNVFLHGSVGP
jgi:hypothetical protein